MPTLPLREGRLLVDRRTHQRVLEHDDPVSGRDQPARFGLLQAPGVDPESDARTEDQVKVRSVGSGGEKQQLLCAGAEARRACRVQAFDLAAHRERVRQRLVPGQLIITQQWREFDDRQRVARMVLDQPVLDLGGDHRRPIDEQSGRGRVVEAAEPVLRQSRSLESRLVRVADREDQEHPFGVETPRDEPEHVSRRRVEPLCVVHDARDRSALRQLAQERQCGHPDQERVDTSAPGQSKGATECLLVESSQGRHHVDRRSQDLVKARER